MNEKEKNVLDNVIESVSCLLDNKGLKHIKMSESKDIFTSAHEAIIFKDGDTEFTITFDDSKSYSEDKCTWENTNYIDRALNRVRIFKVDDSDFIASKWDLEKTKKWYEDEFGADVEELKEVSSEEPMWIHGNDVDIKELGDNDEITTKGKIGSLIRSGGYVWKSITMKQQIEFNGDFETPYILASTEI